MKQKILIMVEFSVVILVGVLVQINGQFPNIFNAMMGGGSGSGRNCLTSAISCMPWCHRSVDSNGCHVCNCQSGPGGMNPMAGPMFGGLSGSSSPMGGPTQQSSDCPAAPRTCLFPPPWCQRLVNEKQCVVCLCGQDLRNFQNSLNGVSTALTGGPRTTRVTAQSTVSSTTTAHVQTTPPLVQSCVLTFTCAKLCEYGYKTDRNGCPLCECVAGGPVDVPVKATDPPGKHPVTTPTSHVTTDVISCPGLFTCSLICTNGYKTDALGCPACECIV